MDNDINIDDMANTNDLNVAQTWELLPADKKTISILEASILPPYLNTCRWFAGKARQQKGFQVRHLMEVPIEDSMAFVVILEAQYTDGDSELYQLPLSFIDTAEANMPEIHPKGIISVAYINQKRGLLVDAAYDERFQQVLFKNLTNNQTLKQPNHKLTFVRGKGLAGEDINAPISSRILPVDSSNTALVFGEKYFMKLYRKLFQQTNPEVEMVSFLTEYSDFAYIPAFAGSFTWQQEGTPDVTLGMVQRMVENQKDSWALTGDYLNDFLYAVPTGLFSVKEEVFSLVSLLGKRTAEMHLGLFAPDAADAFSPESFTPEYRQFLHRRFTDLLDRRYNLLIDNYKVLAQDPVTWELAWAFMEAREMIKAFVEEILTRPMHSQRIRIHGDYHLGQVLATGNDYIIIDFEGEPESSIAERKIKHSPLKDVAGMIRSYHYAVSAKLFNSVETENIPSDRLQLVSERWYKLIKDTYLDAYFDTFGWPHPLFRNQSEINYLLLLYLLEKAVYELGYEISYRPSWVKIPLKGIVDVIQEIEKLRI